MHLNFARFRASDSARFTHSHGKLMSWIVLTGLSKHVKTSCGFLTLARKAKQSASVVFKILLETRLVICIQNTSLLHQPDDYIGITPSCPPHFTTNVHPCSCSSINLYLSRLYNAHSHFSFIFVSVTMKFSDSVTRVTIFSVSDASHVENDGDLTRLESCFSQNHSTRVSINDSSQSHYYKITEI